MTKLHDELAALHEPRNVFGKPLAVSLPIDLRDRIQSALQEHEAQAATIETLRDLLRQRDGGAHDADCKYLRGNGSQRCNCMHFEVLEALKETSDE